MTHFVFRADASIATGSGHVMRCATLAAELAARGCNIHFICREMAGDYCNWLERRGFEVIRLHAAIDDNIDQCREALARIGPIDWLVVDHYELDADWERAMRPLTGHIFVIDDRADRAHDCDLLLDQNLCRNPTVRYAGLIPDTALCLLGPEFAMLRPEFSAARRLRQERDGTVRRIVLCYGGSDPQRHTLTTLHALRRHAQRLERIDVVIGPGNPERKAVTAACAELPAAVLHCPSDNIAGLLAEADLAIGAGGTMNWERACLGVPTVAFGIAENQRPLLSALFEAGCAIGQESMPFPDEQGIGKWLDCALENPALLRGMAQRSAALVDGCGTQRVAEVLLNSTKWPQKKPSSLGIDVLCSDTLHPIHPLLEAWCSRHPGAKLCTQSGELRGGDFLFLISCQELIGPPLRSRYRHCLVVHASDLPQGRGMSPHVWQIIEGRTEITVTLLNADDPFDTGAIWTKQSFRLKGDELCDEINAALFAQELALMDWALEHCDSSQAKEQVGSPSYYKRRTPQDSRLDPEKSLAEQFELLRVADPVRYPAFFDFRGQRYQIALSKAQRSKE